MSGKKPWYWYKIEDLVIISRNISPIDLLNNIDEEMKKHDSGCGHYIYKCSSDEMAYEPPLPKRYFDLHSRTFDMDDGVLVVITGFPEGIKKEDISVEYADGELTIFIGSEGDKGKMRVQLKSEIDPDQTTARYRDGVLILLSKKKEKVTKRIKME